MVLERKSWRREAVFDWLQRQGQVADAEMYRVFNCGIGMTVHLAPGNARSRHRHPARHGPGSARHRRSARRHARCRHRLKQLAAAAAGRHPHLGTRQQYALAHRAQPRSPARPIRYAGCFRTSPMPRGSQSARDLGVPAQALAAAATARSRRLRSRPGRRDQSYSPSLIVLAGFMRILSRAFVSDFAGKILNIHPSLLPKYPGLHTHRRVLEAHEPSTAQRCTS